MFKTTLTYAALAVSATALFFFLHHLGNQIPYELAKQRIATAFQEGNLPDLQDDLPDRYYDLKVKYVNASAETLRPVSWLSGTNLWEQCEILLMVLGGAHKADNAPFTGTVLLRSFAVKKRDINATWFDYCATLQAVAVEDAEIGDRLAKPRYWWGGKALYAIALRHLSVFEINELTKSFIYFAYLLLAVFLLRLAPRLLLIFAPLIVFGFFLSGIRYFPDMVNGLAYLWSVLAAVILALLISRRASSRALHIFCFVAGMVSSYLWLFDGHTLLISSLIALLVYFGYRPYLSASKRAKQAIGCVLLYIVGFLVCFMLGQLTKHVVYEWWVSNNASLWFCGDYACQSGWVLRLLTQGLLSYGHKMVGNFNFPGEFGGSVSWHQIPGLDYIGHFWVVGLEGHYTAGKLLTFVSAFALIGSALFAVVRAYRRYSGVLGDVMFIAGLMAFIYLQFLLPNDFVLRMGRFMFVPHALCWSCLIVVILDWRARRVASARSFG